MKKKMKDLRLFDVFEYEGWRLVKLADGRYMFDDGTISRVRFNLPEFEVQILGRMVFMTDEDIENWYRGEQRSF